MVSTIHSISHMFAVSQSCSEDGMEFTLRTPEGFIGRIYTYGYYDRCFFRGNGATVNVLRISGAQGYPECGTQRVCLNCVLCTSCRGSAASEPKTTGFCGD
jgi:hypothetical protein